MDGELLLATCRAFPDVRPWDDDLVEQLQKRGVQARAVPWDIADPKSGWRDVVLRSTWDYTERMGEFNAWLDGLEMAGTRLWNPRPVVRWNSHKSYLRDLAAKGIPIPPTTWVPMGVATSLAGILNSNGWQEGVVKPAVSADAHNTRRIQAADAEANESWFVDLVRARDMMVQPFLPEIAQGEWAFIFFDGEYSHAVLKRPAAGDWRVQPRLGGSAAAREPTPMQLQFARSVVAAAPPCLYARVDAIWVGGQPLLMELELIEPYLFLDKVPGSAARFAAAIAERLHP